MSQPEDRVLDYIQQLARAYGIEPRDYDADSSWGQVYLSNDGGGDLECSQQIPVNTTEEGPDGTRFVRGMVSNLEANPDYRPRKARGLRSDPGAMWQLWRSEPLVYRWWSDLADGLVAADWRVDLPEGIPEELLEKAEEQREWVERQLFGIQGGWSQFVREGLYCAITGFVLFEIIDRNDGGVRKLAFRRSSTVNQWILDDAERELQAVEFVSPMGSTATVPVENLLHIRVNGFGLDFEGMAPPRPVSKYIEAKQLLLQVEMASASRRGAGIISIESEEGVSLSDEEARKLVANVAAATATRNPVLKSPAGHTLNLLSPAGTTPDFDSLRRWLNQQIQIGLRAESSSTGMDDHGSYALAETQDDKQTRGHRAYARTIEEAVNGGGGSPSSGVIRRMVDRRGGPAVEGHYPFLTSKAQKETQREGRAEDITKLTQAGNLTWTREDEQVLRGEMGLPALKEDHDQLIDEEDGDGELARVDLAASHWSGCGCGTEDMLMANQLDPDRVNAWIESSANVIGRRLTSLVREHRDEFVSRTASATTQGEVRTASEGLRSRYLEKYQNAVRGQIMRLVAKGAGSQLFEMGAISALPKISAQGWSTRGLPTDEFRDLVDNSAARMALHAFNLTDHDLVTNAIQELEAGTTQRKKPAVPGESRMIRVAKTYTRRPFDYGRERVVNLMQAEAKARGFPTEIIAQYVSVLETNSCEPCKKMHGTRVIVGSDRHNEIKPPYRKCDGKELCQCIFSYIMPTQAGYDEILDDLLPGWRQNDFAFSQNDGGHWFFQWVSHGMEAA